MGAMVLILGLIIIVPTSSGPPGTVLSQVKIPGVAKPWNGLLTHLHPLKTLKRMLRLPGARMNTNKT